MRQKKKNGEARCVILLYEAKVNDVFRQYERVRRKKKEKKKRKGKKSIREQCPSR